MQPGDLSFRLRFIASVIESSDSPSRSRVASALARLLLATSRTLGLTVRDALMAEIVKAVPGEFSMGDYYDTNPGGKGFRDGYVSFGVRPMSWDAELLIGGILVQCTYDPHVFKSEKPDSERPVPPRGLKAPAVPETPAGPWKGHTKGGALVELYVTACYYNKLLGGGCADTHEGEGEGSGGGAISGAVDIGDVDLLIDAQENIVEAQVDSAMIARELKQIIADVLANPPAVAKGKEWEKKHGTPTGSPKALLQHLFKNQRSDVGMSEIESLSRAQAARGVGTYSQLLEKNMDWFRKGGWAVNPKS